jgi:hypothetical protein
MMSRFEIAFLAAVIFGTLSSAVACTFDRDVTRAVAADSFVHPQNVQPSIENRNATRSTTEEKVLFERYFHQC